MTGRHFIFKTTKFFLNLTYNGENEPFPILIHFYAINNSFSEK